MAASDISRSLRDDFGLRLHWRTIETALSVDRHLADRRKRDGQWQFAVMQPGKDLIAGEQANVVVVDPDKPVAAVLTLHRMLAELKGPLRLCDPYLDAATIEHLDRSPSGSSIQLLTQNVRDHGPVRRLVAAMKQTRPIEVRITSGKLHDRYLIDDVGILILGASLNGFGKRQSFVIKAGADIRGQMVAWFDKLWTAATPL